MARIGEKTNECGAEVDKSQGKIHLDDMRRWLSKWILNKWKGVDWIRPRTWSSGGLL